MNKITLTQDFELDLTALLNALTRLPEDFGFISLLKEDPRILKEHPDAFGTDMPSINEVLKKVWFENEILTRTGYTKLSYHERTEKVKKAKEVIFNPSNAYGKALQIMQSEKREKYKPVSYFLDESKHSNIPSKVILGEHSITVLLKDPLATEEELDFIDPIQAEASEEQDELEKKFLELGNPF